MEIQGHQNQIEEDDGGDYEICELMTDSAVMENKQSQIIEDDQHDQKVPSIIRNLQQSDPITRISEILGSYNVDLYQQQMKTIRTLGIIPQEKSQMESSNRISNKQKIEQDDVSTKFNTTQSSHTLHKLDSNSLTCFTNYPQSQIGQIYTSYKLKQNVKPPIGFSLFRNYLLKNKLEISSDSFNVIQAKLKLKPKNLSTFFESLKSIEEQNIAYLCLSYIQNTKSLKLNLSSNPKNTHKLHKFYNQYNNHSNMFKQYLWENNCIQTSQNQAIQLIFIKQRDSIIQLKKQIKSVLKERKSQTQLQNCLSKLLQLRELFLFQIQGKGVKFNKPNPLLEIEKRFLVQLNLYSIYKQYFAKDQEKYENKKQKINQKYKLQQIYSYLKIPDCERLVDDQGSPYEDATKQLDNFLVDPYPHLFLFNIQKFYNTLQLCKEANSKTSITSEIEGQRELGLVILCLLQSSSKDNYHKIRFIQHYLKLTDNSKYEKMCLNLPLGLDYIQNSWQTC